MSPNTKKYPHPRIVLENFFPPFLGNVIKGGGAQTPFFFFIENNVFPQGGGIYNQKRGFSPREGDTHPPQEGYNSMSKHQTIEDPEDPPFLEDYIRGGRVTHHTGDVIFHGGKREAP